MPRLNNTKTYAIICLFGLSLSFLSYTFIRHWEEKLNIKEISYRSEARLTAIKNGLESIIDTNQVVRSFITNELVIEHNDSISLHEFQKNVLSVIPTRIVPSMKLMAWLPKLDKENFQKLNAQSFQETGQNLFLTDIAGNTLNYTTTNSWRYPLYFAHFNGEPHLKQGIDIASKPSFLEHMENASLSNAIELDIGMDEDSHQRVSLFLPVFNTKPAQGEIIGYIFSQWDIGTLLTSAIKPFPVSGLNFYLNDDRGINIYTHSSRASTLGIEESTSDIFWQESFPVAEHTWMLSSSPTKFFYQHHPIFLAWASLLFGLVLTLVAMFYFSLLRAREKLIEVEVKLRTRELKKIKQRLEETQKISHLAGWEWDIQKGTLQWSDEVFRIFGHQPQSFPITFDAFNQAIHPDDLASVQKAVDSALKGPDKYEIRHRIILPDQSIRHVHEQAQVKFDKQGQPKRMVGTVQDVSKQHRAERDSQRLAMALTETAESVIITNKDGLVRYVNHSFEKMSGYTSSEVLGQNPSLVKSNEHPPQYYQLMWEKISSGQPWAGSFTNKHKDGSHYKVEQTISPIHDEKRQIIGYVAVQRDVTSEELRRSQMEHTQRLESLGILAGGIAHDFNNLLTAIMGNASLAQMKVRADHHLDKHLSNITSASERAADLCRQMLAYSGQGAYQMHWLDLNRLVHEMNELLQVSLKKDTSVVLDMHATQPWVYGDISQVQQVIMNLVINASEAISETGKRGDIYVSTGTKRMDSKDFTEHFKDGELDSGDYICLTVHDDGPGMNEETKVKIFDPFFTTKFAGRGLGMSAVLGIIHAHRGAMSLDTKLGEGTTFKVYFPCSAVNPDHVDTTPVSIHEKGSQKHGTVLLVDDEAYVLETAEAMLESEGYQILTATTAHEAIILFKQHHQSIELIVLDMTMPEMDGISCARKLREIDDQATILLSSGYSEENITEHTGGLFINGFLQKPYTSDMLTEKVSDMMIKQVK